MRNSFHGLDFDQLELVIQSTGVGIWIWDVQTGEAAFNERWANIVGYTLEELAPVSIDTWLELALDEDLPGSEEALKACWRGDSDYYIYESRMRHKSGEIVWVLDTGRVVEWGEPGVPKRMIGTHLDITQQKREQMELQQAKETAEKVAQELVDLNVKLQTEVARRRQAEDRLNQLAHYDLLTELPNRIFLKKHFTDLVSKGGEKHFSLVFFDLDNFKQVNDQYGHAFGDVVLVEVAIFLNDILSPHGIIGRIGGDEFVAILQLDKENLAEILQTIFAQLKKSITSVEAHNIGLSAGVVFYPEHSDDFTELMKLSDVAMYCAKSEEGNRFVVYS